MSQLKARMNKLENTAPKQPRLNFWVDGVPEREPQPGDVVIQLTGEQRERMEELMAQYLGEEVANE